MLLIITGGEKNRQFNSQLKLPNTVRENKVKKKKKVHEEDTKQ